MAYARFAGKSEVYVYGGTNGLNCVSCRLLPTDTWYDTFVTEDAGVMVRHLQEHRQRGMYVPWEATRRLKREQKRAG